MSGLYYIAPADEPEDQYAAGFDGNLFATRAEAEETAVSLESAYPADDQPEGGWVVREISDEDARAHPFYERAMQGQVSS